MKNRCLAGSRIYSTNCAPSVSSSSVTRIRTGSRAPRPEWLPAYYGVLALVPVLLLLLWGRLAGAPALPGQDALTLRIARHAGAEVLRGVFAVADVVLVPLSPSRADVRQLPSTRRRLVRKGAGVERDAAGTRDRGLAVA